MERLFTWRSREGVTLHDLVKLVLCVLTTTEVRKNLKEALHDVSKVVRTYKDGTKTSDSTVDSLGVRQHVRKRRSSPSDHIKRVVDASITDSRRGSEVDSCWVR